MKTNIELKQDIIDELDFEPAVMEGVIIPGGNPEIGVTAADGVVTLEGVIDSYAKKMGSLSRCQASRLCQKHCG